MLQADGGTRTASITGAYVAVALALQKMIAAKTAAPRALKTQVAAVSVGIVSGEEMVDLCYTEDSRAEVDFNIVMTGEGAEDGEHQFSPGSRKVKVLRDRNKGDLVLVQVMERATR